MFVEQSCADKINKSMWTLYSSRMFMHIASAKIPEREGSISPSSFDRQLPDYQSHVFSLIYPVLEFSFQEMKTWGQSKNSSYCFCVWFESRELGGMGSSRFHFQYQWWKPPQRESHLNSIRHQRWSSSVKTANGLNTLTVKKAPAQTSDQIPNANPTRGAMNLGCGQTPSAWKWQTQAGVQGSG